jgi:hypothetical protein
VPAEEAMRALLVLTFSAIATIGVLATSLGRVDAAPGPGGLDFAAPLFVTSVTPARNRATLPDLSDPGLNNVITVKFSTYPRSGDLLDDGNGVNGLGRKVSFLDQAFKLVRATASLRRNFLTIDPFSIQQVVLPVGRYTLTFNSSIRSMGGRLLNDGRADLKTSFTVGHGRFPVVLVRVSPRHGQTDVGLRRAVVASFDVPIDPLTAFEAVRLEDRSTDPPTPIHALVTVERHGFDVVVNAESPGFAPGAEIVLVIAGRGTATDESAVVLKTEDGIEFKRDWGPRWYSFSDSPTLFHSALGEFDDVAGEFTMTFRTRDATAGSRR